MDLLIKTVVTGVAFFAVLFLTRFLVALLKDSALASCAGQRSVAATKSIYAERRPEQLLRLKLINQNEIRFKPLSRNPGFFSDFKESCKRNIYEGFDFYFVDDFVFRSFAGICLCLREIAVRQVYEH